MRSGRGLGSSRGLDELKRIEAGFADLELLPANDDKWSVRLRPSGPEGVQATELAGREPTD